MFVVLYVFLPIPYQEIILVSVRSWGPEIFKLLGNFLSVIQEGLVLYILSIVLTVQRLVAITYLK